jgi:hypothetical protein
MHHFCTVSAPFFGNSPITNLAHERLMLHARENGAICPRATKAPVHSFAETPISPSISRVFKGYQELILHVIRHLKNHLSRMTNQSKIQNFAAPGKTKVKPVVKFGKPGLQLLAPTIAQLHFNHSATVNKW